MKEEIIKVNGVSICFNLSRERIFSIKEYFVKRVKKQIGFEKFWALNNIALTINKGEVFGIVGLNGAGKSTLLKVISGILKPTRGTVVIRGTIAPLIELGAGFDMDLTAYENIFLNGAILGHDKKTMTGKLKEIISFSELQDFIDVPLKNYSSGMIARLGFSIATCVEPDILIVDEILAVGDYKFQEKCHERMKNMMNNGVTIIFVSHSTEQVKQLCTRAAWIEKGHLKMVGDADIVCNEFHKNE